MCGGAGETALNYMSITFVRSSDIRVCGVRFLDKYMDTRWLMNYRQQGYASEGLKS